MGGEAPYRIAGLDLVKAWRETHNPPDHEYHRVLFFLSRLAHDRESIPALYRVVAAGLPEFSIIVEGTSAQLHWVVIKSPPFEKHLRCIQLFDVRPAPEV